LCPGHNESGGKRRSGKTNPGDVWLADALTEAAWAAIRSKDTYRRSSGASPDPVPTPTARTKPPSP
ncbi:MAG: transposase, partial [Actinobacteria bacterium]|nr:transposase [Actinomycetota bacterium]